MSADIYPTEEFLPTVRRMIPDGYVWMHAKKYTGVIVCWRQEFIAAGGYDERFEFYGPEDSELDARLRRRGGMFGMLPSNLIEVIRTPDSEKIKNYRLPLTKRQMSRRMKAILDENNQAGVQVANSGRNWGQF
jgi:predicted glycosyltransferase involved in capsule biosynthesis